MPERAMGQQAEVTAIVRELLMELAESRKTLGNDVHEIRLDLAKQAGAMENLSSQVNSLGRVIDGGGTHHHMAERVAALELDVKNLKDDCSKCETALDQLHIEKSRYMWSTIIVLVGGISTLIMTVWNLSLSQPNRPAAVRAVKPAAVDTSPK